MDDPSFGTSGGLTKSDLEVSSSYSFLFLAAFTSASLHFLLFQELGLIGGQPTEGQDKVTAGDPISGNKRRCSSQGWSPSCALYGELIFPQRQRWGFRD